MRAGWRPTALLVLLVSGTFAAIPALAQTIPCAEVPGHNDRCPEWTKVYDHPPGGSQVLGDDRAVATTLSPDGSSLFVAGTSTDAATGRDIAVLAIDAEDGTQRWEARHHAPGDGGEVPTDIAVSPDGSRVFVTGAEDLVLETEQTTGSGRFVTLAFDAATGEGLWAATLDGTGTGTDIAFAVEPAPDGSRVYVSGPVRGQGGGVELVTVAYSASTGQEVWRASSPAKGAPTLDELRAELAVSPDGSRVYVAGSEGLTPPSRPADYVITAYEASDTGRLGDEVWSATHFARGEGVVTGLAAAPDGRGIFLSGKTEFQGVTLAIEAATGNTRWDARIGGNGLTGLALSPSGDRVYVTGSDIFLFAGFYGYPPDIEPAVGTGGVLTAGYDASSGTPLWQQRFDAPEGFEEAADLGISPDGGMLYVAALSSRGGVVSAGGCSVQFFGECRVGADAVGILVLTYDTGSGDQGWIARFDDAPVAPVATPAGIAVSTDRILVTGDLGRPVGSSYPPATGNLSDMITLAYAAE